MTTTNDMQMITRRLLALWQEQMSLMSQDPETLGYGETLFKAMGMPVPDGATQQATTETNPNATDGTGPQTADPEQPDGTETDELPPEQHAAMVDELTRRINELAGQIAEYEANTVSYKPEGKG